MPPLPAPAVGPCAEHCDAERDGRCADLRGTTRTLCERVATNRHPDCLHACATGPEAPDLPTGRTQEEAPPDRPGGPP